MILFDYRDSAIVKKSGRLLILDRDSTLIVDKGYTHDIADLQLIEETVEIMKIAVQSDFVIAIATNQSGIDRDYFNLHEYRLFTEELCFQARQAGTSIQIIATCPHQPMQNCPCRKPKPYLIQAIINLVGAIRETTLFIGDSLTDIKAGKSAGVDTQLFESGTSLVKFSEWLRKLDNK